MDLFPLAIPVDQTYAVPMGAEGKFVRRKLPLLVFGTIMFLCLSLQAQLKSNITHYSTEEGLSHDGVLCIMRDHDGFMWFGTSDGINRFDGYNFVVYKSRPGDTSNLRTNKIRNIIEDKAGYLWIKTFDYKMYRFDKKTEQFISVSDGPFKSLFKDQVVIGGVVPDSENGVWMLTSDQGMFYAYDGPSGVPIIKKYARGDNKTADLHGNAVKFLHRDRKGHIWVGTEGGLNHLKRNNENIYEVSPFNAALEKMLTSFPVTCVTENKDSLFFGTANGNLLIYDLNRETFNLRVVSKGIPFNALHYSKTKQIYISTTGRGLITLDPVSFATSFSGLTNTDTYLSLYEDKTGQIWIEPKNEGIVKYNPNTGRYKYFSQKKDFTSLSRDYRVVTDLNGTLWVSMRGGGFGYYNPITDEINYFYDQPGSPEQKFSNVVNSLYIDKTGVLWMSAKDGGVNKVISITDKFNYRQLVQSPQNRSDNDVRAMMKDAKGRLWICTKDGLVHVYDHGKPVSLFAGSNKPLGFVYSILEDSKGNVWLGTKGKGLFKAAPVNPDRKMYRLKQYMHHQADHYSLSNNQVYSVIEDSKGRIWVGTLGGGINLVTETGGKQSFLNYTNTFHHYPYTLGKLVRHLCEDNEGQLWVATNNGLLRFNPNLTNPADYLFETYRKIRGDRSSLGNNTVQYIYKEKNGQIWAGTFGGGLNKVIIDQKNKNKVRFEVFTIQNGLPNDVILSMTSDRAHNIWIATESGLSKFNPRNKSFKNYDSFDGLPKAGFSEATCFTSPDGKLYFGCTEGYISFDPNAITDQKAPAKMALTNIQLYYKDILPGGDGSPLKYAINETESLTLNYNQNVISIDYAVLDYRASNKINYAYKLEGFDKNWHRVNDLRKATYTNIPPGHYTFKVKATSEDLFDTVPEKTLQIIVNPPYYRTDLAYLIYVLLAVGVTIFARRIILTMIRLRNKVVVEQKLTEVKLSFFTNISHELRTPLTLIVSPLEEISKTENLSPKGQEYLQVISRSANRMIRFTNQLLDFRKIQNGKMRLTIAEVDLIALSNHIVSHFTAMAAEKNITFAVKSEQKVLYAWVDEEKIEIIIYNLLSNAFKFTAQDKKITLEINVLSGWQEFEIRIVDEGIGVPQNKLEDIFEIYHEENLSGGNHLKGTGIGLALARGLAINHQGKLWAENNINGGMTFTLRLKAGNGHFPPEEVDFTKNSHPAGLVNTDGPLKITEVPIEDRSYEQLPQVLIVEDNPDLRGFLELKLGGLYRVTTAADGLEGLSIARSLLPDLILSDVMMPNMDGIQLLEQLKLDQLTSHIPVVLLTAKSSVESRIEGLKYGADIYMTKPFNTGFLVAAIENLITSRRKLFEKLSANQDRRILNLEPTEVVITPKDETFLKEVIRIVEDRMKDPGFNIDEVAAAIGMSRTTFYKKLKSLSSLSPVEFVREMRLKRSRQLLDSGEYTISEAGYLSGFNSLPYFSTCFKDKYLLSPSAYLKKIKEESPITGA